MNNPPEQDADGVGGWLHGGLLTSIYQKLGVGNRLELYIYAMKHQLHAPAH